MIKPLLLIFLGFVSLNAYSQNCGGEFQPETGTCRIIGPDGKVVMYNSSPPQSESYPAQKKIIQTTIVHKASKYGAIAHNAKTGVAGGAINMNTLTDAKVEAIKRCENGGQNAPCKVVAWVKNGCLAAAKGKFEKSGKLFKATAEQSGQVEQIVIDQCITSGASGCRIYAPEACSIPDGMYD